MARPEHLAMIQSVVARLAGNSAQVKQWTVTLMAALLGLAADREDRGFALVALYVLVALATLDTYYLALERQYRQLYAEAAADQQPEWCLVAAPVRAKDLLGAATSLSVWLLYGLSTAATVAVLLSA